MRTRQSHLRKNDGFTLVYMAVTLTVLLLGTGIAVDSGRAYVVKAQLTKAEARRYGDDFLGVNSDGRRMLCWTAHGNPPKIADLSGRAHHEPPPHSVRSLA